MEIVFYELSWKVSPPDQELSNTGRCDDTRVPWTMGLLESRAIKQPIQCQLNPKRGAKLRDAYLIDIPLFTERFIDVLRKSGVNNFQTFDVELVDLAGNTHRNYKAVNIIGTIHCADLVLSEYSQTQGNPTTDFTTLVLDFMKVRNLDFFRLGENSRIIILSERVGNALKELAPIGVSLSPVRVSDEVVG